MIFAKLPGTLTLFSGVGIMIVVRKLRGGQSSPLLAKDLVAMRHEAGLH